MEEIEGELFECLSEWLLWFEWQRIKCWGEDRCLNDPKKVIAWIFGLGGT